MTRLFKSRDAASKLAIRPLGGVAAPRPEAARDDILDLQTFCLRSSEAAGPFRASAAEDSADTALMIAALPIENACRCDDMEAELAGLQACLDQAEEAADMREEAAYERGLREGRELAVSDEQARTELLSRTLEGLQADLQERLADTELLALQLARASLARIFGDDTDRAQQVAQTLRHHLGQLQREMVVGIRISPQDFGSPESLSSLTANLETVAVACDSTLASGESAVDLALGRLDLSIERQWQALTQFFDELAQGGTGK